MVLANQLDFKRSDTSSVWCLEYIKTPADVEVTFADSSSNYPFKQSNMFKKKSVINCMAKQATRTKLLKKGFIDFQHFKS